MPIWSMAGLSLLAALTARALLWGSICHCVKREASRFIPSILNVGRAEIYDLVHRVLPAWLRPAVMAMRAEIPTLSTGKHDRAACIELLEGQRTAERWEAGS